MRQSFRTLLLIISTVWFALKGVAQLPYTFTQYTGNNEFPQRVISYMLQDQKGVMWFGTWDGLYSFDGYTFNCYKSNSNDSVLLGSSRVLKIVEDGYNCIWTLCDDHQVYRFNTALKKFQSVPYSEYSAIDFLVNNSHVWITTKEEELIHVTMKDDGQRINATNFFHHHHLPSPKKINRIWLEEEGEAWILTDNGIYQYHYAEDKIESYYNTYQSGKKPFYDITSINETYYITSEKGEVFRLKDGKISSFFLPTHSRIKTIKQIDENKLILGTNKDGFFVYDLPTGHFKHFNIATYEQLKSNNIQNIYVDRFHEAWIQTELPGVVHFNPVTNAVKHFIMQDKYGNNIKDGRIYMHIIEDTQNNLWINLPGGGFALYDRNTCSLKPFFNSRIQEGWSSNNHLIGFYFDRQENLWMSTTRNGLMKATLKRNDFQLLPIESQDNDFPGNNVRAIFQDHDSRIWIGCKDKVIRVYDKQMNYIGNLNRQGLIVPNSKDELGMAYSMVQDHTGTIWIGTKGNGLIAAVPQQSANKFQLHIYQNNVKDLYSLNSNDIYSLHIDSLQRLWIATYGEGINYLNLNEYPKRIQFINYKNELKNYPVYSAGKVRCITTSPNGSIYAGTTNGIVICNNPTDIPLQMCFKRIDSLKLNNNNVHDIHFSTKGEIYVCTYGGGFNKMTIGKNGDISFHSYTTQNGLLSDIILTAGEDNKGNIWFATEHELCKYNPTTEHLSNYPLRSFSQHIIFNEGKALQLNGDELGFNTMMGLLHFNPDSIKNSTYVPSIALTSFQSIKNDIGEATVLTDIDQKKKVTLTHSQNNFYIQFAALDLRYPENIRYAYRLEGFDKNWNEIGKQHNATYTNLPHGDYTLKIKSTNSDGIWVDNVRELHIKILPSFWETPWAYLLYALGILAVIFIASYILFVIFRLKHKVATEQEISDIKLRFFTNISHELRTPLTLIAGPIEQVLQHGKLQETDREQLVLVERNTNRMLRLVNQILDFRKIQNKKMKLRVQQIDLIPFIRHIMESFQGMADEHQIDFQLETSLTSQRIWADADKLEKILFNLLSNAFKYTPEGKGIKVTVRIEDTETIITVDDQGTGIDEQKQQLLFNRFENLVGKNLFNQASTGIGLSLVKELIEMHQGNISVRSKIGEGSSFIIRLPNGKEHFPADTEFILSDAIVTDIDSHSSNLALTKLPDDENVDNEKQTLLIVEDNTELRFFLRNIFALQFNILEAENGKTGWEKCRRFIPDLIISDLMMPEMDGLALLQVIRNERNTSHIPVVLLTAKSTVENKIEGMERGADDYITKPFSASYLKARILNLLEQRKKLQAWYCASLLPDSTDELSHEIQTPALPSSDQQFMDTLLAFIEQHMDNGKLLIEEMAREVGMSRSVFFKKLKALTGLSPNELLKDIRIKRAAALIKENSYSMQQIAYMVGFNDAHYFSRCFKQVYGMTPTEYKESLP